jgi:hypothetical protein
MDIILPEKAIHELALVSLKTPERLLTEIDQLDRFLQLLIVKKKWSPQHGEPGKAHLLGLHISLHLVWCATEALNKNGIQIPVDNQLFEDIARGHLRALTSYPAPCAERHFLRQRLGEMRRAVRLWAALREPVQGTKSRKVFKDLGIEYDPHLGGTSDVIQINQKGNVLRSIKLSVGETEMFEQLLNAPGYQCGDEALLGRKGNTLLRDRKRKMLESLDRKIFSVGLTICDNQLRKS